MIAELKRDINLVTVVELSGVELQQRGTRHVGLCPFHNEKTPSFFVFPDNRFKCFGCGEHGDAIDFAQKLHGFSFPDALKHLGIEQGRITPELSAEIEKRKLERKNIEAQKKHEADLLNTFLLLISATRKAAMAIKTVNDFEKYGEIFHQLTEWQYYSDLLSCGTKEERQQVCKQFRDMEVVPGKRFFKPEFDYSKWRRERKINKNGEQTDAPAQRITISIN